ncbi:MAG: PHB depolymerase family esterase [Gemmatimonadaceae bacterium]
MSAFCNKSCSRRQFLGVASVGAGAVLAGCTGGTEPVIIAPNATLHSRPRWPTIPVAHGYTSLGIGKQLIGRDAVLYVPPAYDPAEPAPLLVLLHGGGGRASGWSSPALQEIVDPLGVVVLAPDSRSYSTWDLLEDGDYGRDVAFIDDALDWTFRRCRVDPARICIGGFSDGASEALGLGVVNGDLFHWIMGFSPGMLHAAHQRGLPRAFISHGTQDEVLPFAETRDFIVPAMRDAGLTVNFVPFDGGHELTVEIASQAMSWFASS